MPIAVDAMSSPAYSLPFFSGYVSPVMRLFVAGMPGTANLADIPLR